MPISALVLQFDCEQARCAVASQLTTDARIALGPPQGVCLPVVTETQTLCESRDLARELEQLPGVARVDLVFANFEDLSPA